MPIRVYVNDRMQKRYVYDRTARAGKDFDPRFKPELTPKQMLALGVFGGKYMRDCVKEFPSSWFTHAKFAKREKDPSLNFFKVDASQPLKVWKEKGWIHPNDPRGWFQWYCRYYMGRRIPEEDVRQIRRWSGMKRHIAQLTQRCQKGNLDCSPRLRQALLHWAYDSRKM